MADQEGPVTVVVRHRVRAGREAEFEGWLKGITADMGRFEGQQGFNVVRPADSGRPEYLVFFRFDSFANLQRWEGSDERLAWLERAGPLTTHAPERERHTGLEVWFTPPPGRAQPPRWRMAAVTLLAIYPLISLVQLTVVPLLDGWPVPLRTAVTSALLVCLMTYAAMPLMTRLFSRWLYGPPG
jgi:antibiotic biosynthesis monooxygenase (ABM) superfamily enzyme